MLEIYFKTVYLISAFMLGDLPDRSTRLTWYTSLLLQNCLTYSSFHLFTLPHLLGSKELQSCVFIYPRIYLFVRQSNRSGAGEGARLREREGNFSFCYLISQVAAVGQPGLSQAKRKRNFIWVSHVGGRVSSTWVSICYLPGCIIRDLD